jgi:hypothetical protein
VQLAPQPLPLGRKEKGDERIDGGSRQERSKSNGSHASGTNVRIKESELDAIGAHSIQDRTLTSREGDILHRHWGESSSELRSRITNYIRYVIDDGALTEWFLDKGADPNATCEWGCTPMSDAMCRASFVTIHMLFARGADIRQGQLLYNALLRDGPEHEVIELVELLLGKGATINEIQ